MLGVQEVVGSNPAGPIDFRGASGRLVYQKCITGLLEGLMMSDLNWLKRHWPKDIRGVIATIDQNGLVLYACEQFAYGNFERNHSLFWRVAA